MKSILLSLVIMSVVGCALMPPTTDPTVQTKRQISYNWSQIASYFTKKEVENILGPPTDIQYSEEAEIWKYEYEISRTFGTISFRKNDNHIWFMSKPSF
ncbi:MAG: hypothetical protein H8D23_17045 [Candidatus Brocadiales bacterium]|nr:hypothetical protein [Candidatus Brocadiales bacterium]